MQHLPELRCVACGSRLAPVAQGVQCASCGRLHARDTYGYLVFSEVEGAVTAEEYAHTQETSGRRVYSAYLQPLLSGERFVTVLDVGCGIGETVQCFLEDGHEAFGVDVPALSPQWQRTGRSPDRFLCCNATKLPFADGSFDVVYSLGVIEHIGTTLGHCTLSPDYERARFDYAREVLRVARSGARVIIACPNKRFPVDIQHGVTDAESRRTALVRAREYVHRRTGLNVHRTWGRYHLLSHGETSRLFRSAGPVKSIRALPLSGYFGFVSFASGRLAAIKKLASAYVEHLPAFLRPTALNPYVLVEIRKG